MTDHGRRVVIGASSIDLRRALGPTGWVVFEELLLVSSGPVEACHASVSVRSLAARLGLAKDTVARALVRLRRAGLVTATQSRTAAGVFTTGSYQLTIPSSITIDDHTVAPPPTSERAGLQPRSPDSPHSPRPSRSPRSSRLSGSQLALAIEA